MSHGQDELALEVTGLEQTVRMTEWARANGDAVLDALDTDSEPVAGSRCGTESV